MNKPKKTQADVAKEHGVSQPTVSRRMSEYSELKNRLDIALAREREAKASLRELQLQHEAGRFIELAVVERDGVDTAERVLAVLRSIPQRTAASLECDCRRAATVEVKISEEIERAVADLRESLYIKPTGE